VAVRAGWIEELLETLWAGAELGKWNLFSPNDFRIARAALHESVVLPVLSQSLFRIWVVETRQRRVARIAPPYCNAARRCATEKRPALSRATAAAQRFEKWSSSLRDLCLDGTKVTDAGILELSALPRLTRLGVFDESHEGWDQKATTRSAAA
jgi:hypothetical protein